MKRIILFLLLLCSGSIIFAQESVVTGTVVSEADGETLPGASVVVKGTTLGTVTDVDGAFSINLPTGKATLVISYLGFTNKEVNVTSGTKGLKVALSENTQKLDELVVVGYGTMKRPDLTGAISSIRSKDIEKSSAISLEQAMQGRVAGVQVTSNSGAPGGGISVSIRGINSLSGNEPLYVIDGIAISGQTSGNSSVLSTINPADIASIDVLKDASSTAIYGSRASNGVIMITTKQGEQGKPKLSYNGYYGLQQIPSKIAVMTLPEYAEYYNERATIQGWGLRDDFRDPSLLGNGTDWQSELFRSAPMQNHDISISGGNGGAKYYISGGFLNQDGIGIGSNFRRFSFRSNLDLEITKWLNAGVNGSLGNTKQTTTMDNAGVIRTAISQRPDIPAHNLDGSYGIQTQDQFNTYQTNPLAEAQMRENYNTGTEVNYNFYANLKLLKGLTFRAEYGGRMTYGNNYSFTPDYAIGNYIVMASSENKGTNKSDNWTFKQILTYDLKLAEKNAFQITAVHEANAWKGENLSASRTNYFSDAVHSLHVGDQTTMGNDDGEYSGGMESYLGRFHYDFDNRYLLDASVRYDGSSNFGPNKRWGTFPSAALAWRVNNESFLKDVEAISNLKLRFSWGINGNSNAGGFAYGVSMKTVPTYWGTGFISGNYANPDLQWEQLEAYNLGLDLALFKSRVIFTADFYNKNIDNLLMQASLPGYVVDNEQSYLAIEAPWVNTGALSNKGMDLSLNTVNIKNRNLTWSSNFTFSLVRNQLKKLYNDSDVIFGYVGNSIYTKSEIGQPIGQFFGYNVIGMFTCEDDFYKKDNNGKFILDEQGNRVQVARPVDPNAKDANGNPLPFPIAEDKIWVGDYIFEDVNGDGVIDEKDRKYLGNPNPKFTYGIDNTFTWKNFELNLYFYGIYGNKVYNALRAGNSGTSGYTGHLEDVAGFARIALIDPNGGNVISNVHVTNAATATASRIYAVGGNTNDNERMSSRFLEDGSYLRLQNVSLTYSVPKQWLQKVLHVDLLQVYANVQNLFTITKYKGYDPEVGSYSVLTPGIDNGRYPSQRVYKFGIRFNF